jgi:hypothetical protein
VLAYIGGRADVPMMRDRLPCQLRDRRSFPWSDDQRRNRHHSRRLHVTPSFELLYAHDTRSAAPDLWDEDIDKLRLAAEAITTWSPIRDEALTCPLLHYPRSDLNPARSSSVKIFGCSQAAK